MGDEKQLIAVPMPQNPNSLELNPDQALEVLQHISKQYMALLYQNASQIIGQCILQAGLVGKRDTKNLTRLLRAACLGAHKATMEEASAISNEHERTKVPS